MGFTSQHGFEIGCLMISICVYAKAFFPCLLQSMVAFLKDPEGAPLWEEDPEAKDIVHVDSEKVN